MPKNRTYLNKTIQKLIPKSRIQRAGFESAGIVASTSGSGSQSTQSTSNLAAVSAAAKLLNDVVGCIDLEDDVSSYDEDVINYIGKIEHYQNHRLPEGLKSFELPKDRWERVAQAAKYARTVHAKQKCSNCFSFVPTSLDKSTRGFGLYEDRLEGSRILLVAFRATRSLMEWMANTNVAAITCEEFGSETKIHKGLGSIAKKTQHLLVTELNKAMAESTETCSLIFTGHSSGGAIAQLLFGFMNSESTALSRFKAGIPIITPVH
ncbi:hypothetical protein K491DRAFT_711042 [Lophiostoma macrostomum CBS 122681]|uniref:Fungal lipase-type domain-containing protein n=1 Tax=Lophiostoma macrostomum CBS 122681 TaxID=1314788 RepID=A0A6A6TQD4_9PLEO|nr:hypothetical protein K491DRAFT_711042 [Lophiostoma macrostomum CBS 122681]